MSVIPVTTCTVERSFSPIKTVKTIEEPLTLDMFMKIAVEGPKTLNNKQLDMIVDSQKKEKPGRLAVYNYYCYH